MVFHDTEVIDLRRYILGAKVYVSVLSADLSRACVDYLAEGRESRPQHTWRGDTLFLASQEVRDSVAVTRIQGFLVDASGCEWLPVGRFSSGRT